MYFVSAVNGEKLEYKDKLVVVLNNNTIKYHNGGDESVLSRTDVENINKNNVNTIKRALVGGSVTSIGDVAFFSCQALTSIDIPEGVTSIGDSAFMSCVSLTSIDIPDSVTTIGDSAFINCLKVQTITLPDKLETINDSAFAECSALTSIDIPEGVTSIGDTAFYHCEALTNIKIPDSVTSIGYFAFMNCLALTAIKIESTLINTNDDNTIKILKGSFINTNDNFIFLVKDSVVNVIFESDNGRFSGKSISDNSLHFSTDGVEPEYKKVLVPSP